MFSDDPWLSAAQKETILRDWQTFIRHGFRLDDFTEPLYHHLIRHAHFIAHYDRETFWDACFNDTFGAFARFLNQFGGDLRSAELGLTDWLAAAPAADLNAALIAEMRLLFEPFIAVLEEEAIAAHEAEKWAELRALNSDADSRHLRHLALIYDDLYPLRDFAQYQPVTPAVRDRLRQTAANHLTDRAAPTLFQTAPAAPDTGQASLFEAAPPPLAHPRLAAQPANAAASGSPQEVSREHPAR